MSANEPLIVTPFDRLRFMTIDDDRAMLDLTEALLKAAGVGSVIKTTSALSALNVLADHRKRADCIVCDHGMPHMTGLELLRDIRAGKYDHVPRNTRFIMLTAHGEEEVVKAAIGLDVTGYVMKPITKDSLTKAIHRAFNKTVALKSPGDYMAIPMPSGT
jgi:DNA-binding NarL/FixJ family response regulator